MAFDCRVLLPFSGRHSFHFSLFVVREESSIGTRNVLLLKQGEDYSQVLMHMRMYVCILNLVLFHNVTWMMHLLYTRNDRLCLLLLPCLVHGCVILFVYVGTGPQRKEKKRKESLLCFKAALLSTKECHKMGKMSNAAIKQEIFLREKGPKFFCSHFATLSCPEHFCRRRRRRCLSLSSFSPSQPLCQTSIWLRHCFLSFFLSLTNTFFAASWAFCMALTDRKISSLFHSMSTMCTLR